MPWVMQRYFRSALSSFTLQKFINAGFAVIEMKLGVIRVRSRPYVLRIEPVNLCNLRCPLCACGANTDPREKGFMTISDFTRILEENKKTAILVRLDGMGEPTLHPKLFHMIRIAKSYGMSVTIHSNFHTDACAQPDEFLDSGLDRLVITIDGATQETYQRYRVGGCLDLVVERLQRLVQARRKRATNRPIIEVQFIDFGYNHHEIPEMRRLVRQWGADKFEISAPDQAVRRTRLDPQKPRRCFWLWNVLTVTWNLDYRPCTNAWSVPWPRLNMRDVPSREFWNHELMLAIRQYNLDMSSQIIANDSGCKCNRCPEMLVQGLDAPYFCE